MLLAMARIQLLPVVLQQVVNTMADFLDLLLTFDKRVLAKLVAAE
jgi:hypothetical protein